MPFADFACDCGHVLRDEFFHTKLPEVICCPECGQEMKRQWTVGLRCKGDIDWMKSWNPEMALHPETGAEYNQSFCEHRSQTSRYDTPGIPNFINNPDKTGPGKKVKYFNGFG